MDIAYSQSDVYRSLLEQGYSPARAEAMANAIGNVQEQSSNIVPNLAETAGYMAAAPAVAKMLPQANKLAGFGRFALPGMAGNLAGLGVTALTGNNFYEKASGEQLAADLGGQIVGGIAGARLAKGLDQALQARGLLNPAALGEKYVNTGIGKYLAKNELTDQQYKKILAAASKKGLTGIESKAMNAAKNSAAKTIGRIGNSTASRAIAGRALGSAIGSVVPGVGTLAGSIIGGYLLPKFFANDDEKLVEPDKGLSNSTVAGLGAAAALASPMGAGARGLIKKGASKANEWMGDPAGQALNSDVGQWAREVLNRAKTESKAFTNPIFANPFLQHPSTTYTTSKNWRDGEIEGTIANKKANTNSWLNVGNPIENTYRAYRQTGNRFGAIGDAMEDFGYQLGSLGRGTN